jgi:hypothetical protein
LNQALLDLRESKASKDQKVHKGNKEKKGNKAMLEW